MCFVTLLQHKFVQIIIINLDVIKLNRTNDKVTHMDTF